MDRSVIGADPFAMLDPVSGEYYIYATHDDGHNHFIIYHSKDLVNYDFVGFAYNDLEENNWGKDWFWAPECYYNPHNKLYYIFYSARVKNNLTKKYFLDESYVESCKIGVMVSSSPRGPFKNINNEPMDFSPFDERVPYLDKVNSRPFEIKGEVIDAPKGVYVPAIDADLYFEEDGRIFLFFSRCCYLNYTFDKKLNKYIEESNISFVELNPDFWFDESGKTMPTIKPQYQRIIDGNRKDTFTNVINYRDDPQEWENAHVNDYENNNGKKNNRRWSEGSMVLKHKNKYYLFYSCNNYENKYYGVGVAVGDIIKGPYKKHKDNPLISQNPSFPIYSTGHGSITKIGNEYMYVFHGRDKVDVPRSIYSARICFLDDKIIVDNIHHGILKE